MAASVRSRYGPWDALLAPSSGALTGLKWLGLALMVVDHVDAFVFDRSLGWATLLGRLVVPIFAFVLAFNLARPGAFAAGVHARMLRRLCVVGLVALPFHAALVGSSWPVLLPLNIMFTFAVAVGVVCLLESRRFGLAALAFVVGSALVEYWWPGVGLVVAWWAFLRRPSHGAWFGVVACTLALSVANASHAALWGLPLVMLACQLRFSLPRAQWAFYAFYPAHLAAFWLVS